MPLSFHNFICKFSLSIFRGKGATERKVDLLRALRRLLSKTEIPPIEAAIRADVIPALVQCLSFGSEDEQVQRF